MSHEQKTALLQHLEVLSDTIDALAENPEMWDVGAQVEDIIAIVRATPTHK